MVSIFESLFLHFKNLVNKGQILNFYRHFIYENIVKNFRVSGFVDLQDESVI